MAATTNLALKGKEGYTMPASLSQEEPGVRFFKGEKDENWRNRRATERLFLLLLEHHPERRT